MISGVLQKAEEEKAEASQAASVSENVEEKVEENENGGEKRDFKWKKMERTGFKQKKGNANEEDTKVNPEPATI